MNTMLLRAVLALVITLSLVGASTGTAASKKDKPTVDAKPQKPVKADRDGDKVFDDLEARLAGMAAGDEVRVIVTLDAPATQARVDELGKRVGKLGVSRRFQVIDGFAATVTKGQAEALTHVPWVARVEEDSPVQAHNDTAQSSFGVTKARADAPGLDGDADGNADSFSGADLVAAVIDTGIDAAHLDLDEGKVLAFKDFVNGRTTAYDDNGHGTHVAATIAGDGDARADKLHKGVAPGAALVGVKALDANGGGTMSSVTAAIDWVVQNKDAYGIEVVNLSLGVSGCSDGTDATSVAVNNANAAGLVVAVAAGNDGPAACTIGSPAAATGALTVGAMADLGPNGFSLASFSSRGPTADGRTKPDLVAPGVEITSAQTNTTSGYVAYSGTSMATPFVAGVALLMRDANATLTPQAVKEKLVGTAVDWGRAGADGEYGAGRLDAYAALASAGAQLTAPPAAPAHSAYSGSLSGTGAVVDYKLDVASTAFPIAATLVIPGISGAAASSPDFDLYLYNPSGGLVAWAETVERQETIGFRPTATGVYTLRVSSYAGSGGYLVDVSAGLRDGSAPPPAPAPVAKTAFPSSFAIYAGTLRSGDASRLGADDDLFLAINSTTSYTRQTDWYGQARGISNGLTSLKVTYRGKSSVSCNQTVWLYNWTYGVWDRWDARTLGTTETEVNVSPTSGLAQYVSGSSGDGDVAVRVRCTRGDGVSFFTSADLLKLTYS